MHRYIDADKVVKWSYSEPRYSDSVNDRTDLRDFLLSLPTVSPDEVRGKGKWIERADDWYEDYAECSNCHDEYTIPDGGLCFKFCPNCGAKMEVEGDA